MPKPRLAQTAERVRPGVEALRAVPAFKCLDVRLLSQVDAISEIVSVEQGTELCREGEPPAMLYFLLDGQVAMTATAPDGTRARWRLSFLPRRRRNNLI